MSTSIQLRREADILKVREAVRLAANALDFGQRDLRLVLAAVSELSIDVLEGGGGGILVSGLRRSGREGISIVITLQGVMKPACAADEAGLGFAGARKLLDEYEVSVRDGRTIVHAIQWRGPPVNMTGEYRSVLEDSAARPREESLHRAFVFGRRAVLNGLGLPDMAALHRDAMDRIADRENPPAGIMARECFEEALGAFEMVYRGFPEARNAMRNINELLEQETERMAHTLHDEAGQTIAALSIGIDELECGAAACIVQARRLKAIVEDAGNLFRGLSHELRPPLLDDAGLAPALRALCESLSSRHGFRVSFRDKLQRRLAYPVEKALYRTAQVGLANVARHACARNATVSIGVSGKWILCSVRDDGRGMDANGNASGGLGLQGVRKSAAALGGTIKTAAVRPHGFELRICLPDPDAGEAGEPRPGRLLEIAGV
jgi:hypothetical protein